MEHDTKKIIEEQLQSLPAPVRLAIESGEIERKMRTLSQKYGLHLDQWSKLENQIMLTVLGLAESETMVDDIASQVGIPHSKAEEIVTDVGETIFAPIREELERELEHPDAKMKEVSNMDKMRQERLGPSPSVSETLATLAPTPFAPPFPSTKPAPAVPVPNTTETEQKPLNSLPGESGEHSALQNVLAESPRAVRAPLSSTYQPKQASHERKVVEGDPYREQVD